MENKDTFQVDLFVEELKALTLKHNLTNCVFAANHPTQFVGLFGLPPVHSITEFAAGVENAARCYQGAREKLFFALRDIAGK